MGSYPGCRISRQNNRSVGFEAHIALVFTAHPFTPKSDQCLISPVASPEIWHRTVWRTWLFIAYSGERYLYIPLPYLYIYLQKVGKMYFLNLGVKGLIVRLFGMPTQGCCRKYSPLVLDLTALETSVQWHCWRLDRGSTLQICSVRIVGSHWHLAKNRSSHLDERLNQFERSSRIRSNYRIPRTRNLYSAYPRIRSGVVPPLPPNFLSVWVSGYADTQWSSTTPPPNFRCFSRTKNTLS